MENIYYAYSHIVHDRYLFASSIFLSLLIWGIKGLTCYLTTPGGVGIYESIIISVLILAGFEMDVALAVAISDHVTKKLFTLAIGVPGTGGIIGSHWRHLGAYFKSPKIKFNG